MRAASEQLRWDPTKWWFWGRWNQCVLSAALWARALKSPTLEELGIEIQGDEKVLFGNFYILNDDYKSVMESVAGFGLDWFDRYFAMYEQKVANLDHFEGEFEDFLDLLIEVRALSAFVELVDRYFVGEVEKACKRAGIPLEDALMLMQPKKRTILTMFHDELRARIDDKQAFVKKWEWIGTHAFEGAPFTLEKLDEIVGHSDSTVQETAETTILKDDALSRLIDIGQKLAYFRSYSIEISDRAIYRQRSQMNTVAAKQRISYDDLLQLTDLELRGILNGEEPPDNFRERGKRFGYVGIGDEIEITCSDALDKELGIHAKEIIPVSEVRGSIACKGKAIGTARIILEPQDIAKVGLGDIIIASETLPDYIMAMQKAAAFVTDQGGVTSHAALVAREMRKPCVIGTKVATQVFKDGYMVEVDAEKGIVRKI